MFRGKTHRRLGTIIAFKSKPAAPLMPSFDDHIDKAHHNEQLIAPLSHAQSSFPDWVVVGAFYAALHYVDACLALRNIHPPTHHQRSGYVARVRDLKSVYPDYRTLEDVSRDARYTNNPVSPVAVTSSLENLKKIQSHLLPILFPPAR